MLPDRVSNPGPLTYESGALPIALMATCIFVILKSGTAYTREPRTPDLRVRCPTDCVDGYMYICDIEIRYSIHERERERERERESHFSSYQVFVFPGSKWVKCRCFFFFFGNSHYKRLCASFCTFETVQKIKVG